MVSGARALSGRVPAPDHPDLSALGFRFSPKGTFAQRSRFSWRGLWERLCVHALTGACARAAARGAGVRRNARTCLRASASQETASIAGSGAQFAGGDRINSIGASYTVLRVRTLRGLNGRGWGGSPKSINLCTYGPVLLNQPINQSPSPQAWWNARNG